MALAVLTALLLSSSLPVNAAAEDWLLPKTSEAPAFADTAGVWCEPEISVVCQVGLMAGKSADRFASQDPLTYAQITVIAARLHALLNGQDGTLPAAGAEEAWYQPALSLLEAECADPDVQSILKGFSDPAFPDSPCTRRSFALLLSGVLTEPLPAINDVDRVPDNMDPAVLALYNAGILTGSDTYGTFDEDGTLNRGQAAAMLARLVDPSLRQRFTLEPFDLCTDVLGLAPEAVVLTVGGAPVTAAEFANDLCTALHQAGGGSRTALDSAIHTWCFYTAPFQVLAEEKVCPSRRRKWTRLPNTLPATTAIWVWTPPTGCARIPPLCSAASSMTSTARPTGRPVRPTTTRIWTRPPRRCWRARSLSRRWNLWT